ncbi:MAG: hypothetical protein HFH50_11615 [Lachnospiraceae bacterium]|jgi:hypothetical protein|nr:hypothetical protein [Lachnospiraceae bacterium]
MDNYTFLQTMGRGRHPEGAGIAESSYCIFTCPIQEPVVHQRIFGDEAALTLELNYGEGDILSDLRLRQAGTNLIVEESSVGLFGNFLTDREVKYIGQAFIYALMFKIDNLKELIESGIKDMKTLEDSLDNRIDNSGTYQILDFRRRYTEYGNQIISLKEIIARIDKGYYPMQMQNSYVLQGQLALDFKFLEERYELNKNTIIKDLDTYTSIVSNNLSRNTRLLTLVSLGAVALNFMFGSLLAVSPAIGVTGGVLIGGLTAGAAVLYRSNGSRRFPRLHDSQILPDALEEKHADNSAVSEEPEKISMNSEEA